MVGLDDELALQFPRHLRGNLELEKRIVRGALEVFIVEGVLEIEALNNAPGKFCNWQLYGVLFLFPYFLFKINPFCVRFLSYPHNLVFHVLPRSDVLYFQQGPIDDLTLRFKTQIDYPLLFGLY